MLTEVLPHVYALESRPFCINTPLVGVHLYYNFVRDLRGNQLTLPDPERRVSPEYLPTLEDELATYGGPLIITEVPGRLESTARRLSDLGRPDALLIETIRSEGYDCGEPKYGWDVLLNLLRLMHARNVVVAGGYLEHTPQAPGGMTMCLGDTIVAMERVGFNVDLLVGAIFYFPREVA
jgi:hypothetical protein